MKIEHSCPLCRSAKLSLIYKNKWKSSHFTKCKKCGLVFQNPQESLEQTKARYDESYFEYEKNNEFNFFNLVKKTIDDFKLFDLIPKKSNILEIGCATGLFLQYVETLGHKAIGVELCSQSAEYGICNNKVNIKNCRLEEAGFEKESFDFIHFSHLIEHLNDPFSFLDLIYSLLKKDGIIILTTPNKEGLFSGLFKEDWRCIVDDHLFLFNRSNLKSLLRKKGFTIINDITWGSIPSGKTWNLIKKITDILVKKTKTGDVVSILAKKF